MEEFLSLVLDAIGAIFCAMSVIYVSVTFIESLKVYYKEQSFYNLFMASINSIICVFILWQVFSLFILFIKGEIL